LSFSLRSVVNTVAFHPESQCLASGSADRTVKMWDVRSHLLIQHYPAHDDEVTSISMHPVSPPEVYLTLFSFIVDSPTRF